MAEYVISAAKGSKRAMSALYEMNKRSVFAFASVLLEDEALALEISKEVINRSWDRIIVKDIKTDKGFRRYLMCETARLAASWIFGSDIKNFRIAKIDSKTSDTLEQSEFSGDAFGGVKLLGAILSECDKYNRFVFLLKNAGGLNFIHIGQVIAQRETVAKYFYENAVTELANHNADISSARSMYEKYEDMLSVPAELGESCVATIKSRARFELPEKKVIVAVTSVVCALFLSVMAFVILKASFDKAAEKGNNSSGEYTDTTATASGDTSNNQAAVDKYTGYVPPEIDTEKTYTAEIKIKDYGTVRAELYPKDAPMTVANFVDLANSGFYNGLTFHRIIDGFMMQGGDPLGNGTGGSNNEIFGEFKSNGFVNNIKHEKGVLSMARSSNKNGASSQFFIMHDKASHLDGDYAAFGKVIEGIEIVDKICTDAKPTDSNGTIPAAAQPIIESITITVE